MKKSWRTFFLLTVLFSLGIYFYRCRIHGSTPEGPNEATVESACVAERGPSQPSLSGAIQPTGGNPAGPGAPETEQHESGTGITDRFADATVMKVRTTVPDANGCYERKRLVRGEFKYPLILLEESLRTDSRTGVEQLLRQHAMVADHVMVKVRPGAGEDEVNQSVASYGGRVRKKMYAPDLYLVEFQNVDLDSVAQAVQSFGKAAGSIVHAEPDYIQHTLSTIPNDPRFGELWGLHNTGQSSGIPGADISAPEAWDITTGNRNILVAVIDSGIDYTHPDLEANMWINPGEAGVLAANGIDDDGNGFIDDYHGWDFYNDDNNPMDDNSHGTHCAGTIGAVGNNSTGVAGVCWNVSLVGLKFLGANGSGLNSDGIDAIYYATSLGCRLTSDSWGGSSYSDAMKNAIADAGQHGILFVAAAGNAAADNDETPHYPSSYTNGNVIAVANSTRTETLSESSCYGLTSVDLAAPGSSVLSTIPGGGYGTKSGTSMAAPHVAGAAALLWSYNPDLSSAQIKTALMASVDTNAAFAGKMMSGGRLNVNQALRSLTGLYFDEADYFPAEWATLSLLNSQLAGSGTQSVQITTANGDSETLVLYETSEQNPRFTNCIWIVESGTAVPGNGQVESVRGPALTAVYTNSILQITNTATASVIPRPAVSETNVIVRWGMGNTNIVPYSSVNCLRSTTYTTNRANPAVGANYYPDSTNASPFFSSAFSTASGISYCYSYSSGDYVNNDASGTNGAAFSGMMMWRDFLVLTNLTDVSFQISRSTSSTTNLNVRLIVEKNGNYYISDIVVTNITSYMSSRPATYSISTEDLNWYSFAPFVGGTETIGAAASVTMNNLTGIGYYFTARNCYKNTGSAYFGLNMQGFEACGVVTEPATNPVLDYVSALTSDGDGDGKAEPGEAINTFITLSNQGNTADHVTASVVPQGMAASIFAVSNSPGSFGTITTGGRGSNSVPFVITATNPAAPTGIYTFAVAGITSDDPGTVYTAGRSFQINLEKGFSVQGQDAQNTFYLTADSGRTVTNTAMVIINSSELPLICTFSETEPWLMLPEGDTLTVGPHSASNVILAADGTGLHGSYSAPLAVAYNQTTNSDLFNVSFIVGPKVTPLTAGAVVTESSGINRLPGQFERGEVLNITVLSTNNGYGTVNDITHTLSADPEWFTITAVSNAGNYISMGVGAVTSTTYQVTISPTTPRANHVFYATNRTGDYIWDAAFSLAVTGASNRLTVVNGSGDGRFMELETVPVAADTASPGQRFDRWTGDTVYVADVLAASTHVTMPAQDIQISAVYADDYDHEPGVAALGTLLNDPTASVEAVVYANSYVYAACGYAGLIVFDVSNPANPIRVGGYDTEGFARALTVQSNQVFIADDRTGLQVLDITDPAHPVLAGTYETGGICYDIAVSGQYAYLAAYSGGLLIFDISDSAAPQLLKSYNAGTTRAYGVAVDGNYAYVADYTNGLKIIDVSTPADPVLTGFYAVNGQARDVAVQGGYAYVAAYTNGLKIINVSNPSSPVQAGEYITKYAYGIAVEGSFACLANGSYGVELVDISNPSMPVSSGVFDDSKGIANGVFVADGMVYVANDYGGIQLVDISVPTLPALVGSYDTHRYAYDVAVKGSYAYLAAYQDGIITVDISNPDAPVIVATNKWATYSYAYRLDISGDTLYVAANSDGLVTYDLSVPAAPVLITKYDFVSSGFIRDVKVSGNYAFCVNGYIETTNALSVLDVSRPGAPVYISGYNTGGAAYGIDVQGQYAYLASFTNGLQIFDVSSPASPVLKGVYKRASYPYAGRVSVCGDYAYALDVNDVLQIVDIRDPENPTLRRVLDLGTVSQSDSDISVQEPYVYIAYGHSTSPANNGLWIVDVRDMDNLVVTNYLTSGYGRGVAVSGGYVYLADEPKALHIFTHGEKEVTGLFVAGASVVNANSTNEYTCHLRYTDGSVSDATGLAAWSLVDDAHGAALNGSTLSVGDITFDATVMIQAVYSGVTNTHSVTLKFIPPRLTGLGTLFTNVTADTEAIVYSNGYAYVACGYAGLIIFDVSDPANPVRAGGYDTEGFAAGLTLRSNLLFVADGNADLQIVDVSTPSSPVLAGRWQSNYDIAYAKDVEVSGSYAYLVGSRGMQILDISSISDLRLISEFETDYAWGVAIDDHYAYVADSTNGLRIIDVSTPTRPVLAGSCISDRIFDVVVQNGYAYVAAFTNGLQIIDVSNPASPTVVGSCVTNTAVGIVVQGSLAFLANSGYGLRIVDISNPFTPTLAGTFDDNKGFANGVSVADGKAYVANDYGGIQIMDVSSPGAPVLLGSYDTHRYAYDVAVKGSYAYLAGYRDGLVTVDISSPAAPAIVASNIWESSSYAYRMDISGDTLYVAADGDGLVVYDLSNPASPAFVTKYDFVSSGYIRDVKVSGNYAFCVNGFIETTNALSVLDVSRPGTPVYIGGYNTGGAAYGVDVQGQYAYLASGTNGLQIFDVSNASNPPVLKGTYFRPPADEFESQPSYVYGVAACGNYVYTLNSGATLAVIEANVSDPQSSTLKGLCNLGGAAFYADIFVQYPYVYIAHVSGFDMPERNGLWIIDVSDPANPVVVADHPTSGYSHGVTVNNGHVYLADDPKGLHTFTWGSVPVPSKTATNLVVYRFPGDSDSGTLSAKTTNSYQGYIEFSDRSIQSVTTSAVWTVVGEPPGAVFDQNRLTADGVISNGAVITVQGSLGGFSGALDVTLYYDRNTNGIPDWWELRYSGGLTDMNPGAICSNGVNTLREAYIVGLDPNDPQSVFLTSILSGRTLQWSAISGRVYSVYWTTNLMAGFQCLESNIPWTRSDFTNTPAVPSGYYKIDVRLE